MSRVIQCLPFALLLFAFYLVFFFFFNDTATTEIYTLSLHDALPICGSQAAWSWTSASPTTRRAWRSCGASPRDRKSTRLNSSHTVISYAVFCLKKKKKKKKYRQKSKNNNDAEHVPNKCGAKIRTSVH